MRGEKRGDDAHRLLRVIAAVVEGVQRRRNELRPAEDGVDPRRRDAGLHAA